MKFERMTRREASLLIASTLGVGLLPRSLFGQESRSPASWKVGRSVGALQPIKNLKLDESKKAGFQCIEVSVGAKRVAEMEEKQRIEWYKELKTVTNDLGIEPRSVHIPFGKIWDISDLDENVRKKAVKDCLRYFDLVEILGAKIYVLHPSYEPIKAEDRPKRIEKCIESLREMAPIAREKGVRIALENLPRTCLCHTSAETIHIVDAVDVPEGLQVCFDSNHTLQEKPEEFVSAVGKRIITTHMSDYDGIDEKHWLPFEGIIHWKAVMKELVKTGYPGPFVFETGRFKDRPAGIEEIYATWLRIKDEYEKG